MRGLSSAFGALVVAASTLLLPPLVLEGARAVLGQGEEPRYSGSLLYVSRGGIWQMNLASLERRPFLSPPNTTITHVAHSWDRQRLAYSMSIRGSRFELLESSIEIASIDGSERRTVVHEDRTGATVEWPSWSPHGTSLVYSKTVASERTQRIEEVELATGIRTLVAEAGSSPAYSADGQSVVFPSPAGRNWAIWSVPRAGEVPHAVVTGAGFDDVDHPLYAPDGSFIAFLGAGSGPPPLARPHDGIVRRLGLLIPVVSAHPLPGGQYDLWTVRPDGSGLDRAAELTSEEPYLSWSPDGHYLASWGRLGLQIVDMWSDRPMRSVRWLTALPGGSPISWGP